MIGLRKVGHCCDALGGRPLLKDQCVSSAFDHMWHSALHRGTEAAKSTYPLYGLRSPSMRILDQIDRCYRTLAHISLYSTIPNSDAAVAGGRREQDCGAASERRKDQRSAFRAGLAEKERKWCTRRTRVVRIPRGILDGAGVSNELADTVLLLCIPKADSLVSRGGGL